MAQATMRTYYFLSKFKIQLSIDWNGEKSGQRNETIQLMLF